MTLPHEIKGQDELYRVLASLKGEDEFRAFFEDLCTFKEIEQMAQRLEGAELLLRGKTYTQVTSESEISTATLSRVSRCIQYGSGGYSTLLARYLGKENEKKN